MEIEEQIRLRFTGVDFPSVILNSIKPSTEIDTQNIKINIQPKVFIPSDSPNTFKIIMKVELEATDYFTLNVTGVGTFELSKEDVSDEVRRTFINANSTAIMFPYVRAFISTLTSNLGGVMSPILLPTRFFKGDYLEEVTTQKD